MATFKFTGGIHKFQNKLVTGMLDNGYTRDFAERTFKQLEGFGNRVGEHWWARLLWPNDPTFLMMIAFSELGRKCVCAAKRAPGPGSPSTGASYGLRK